MAAWTLHFDGLYEPRYADRGVATYGFVATHADATIHEESGLVAPPRPLASANSDAPMRASSPRWPDAVVAEYGALIQSLAWLAQQDTTGCDIHVRGDSQLVIETVARRWNLTSPRLIPLRDAATRLAQQIGVTTYQKISREQNARADALSREAYHRLVAAHPEWKLDPHRPNPPPSRL